MMTITVPELIERRKKLFADGSRCEMQFKQTDYVALTDEENKFFHELCSCLDDRTLGALAAIVSAEGMNRNLKLRGDLEKAGTAIKVFDKRK